MKKEIPILMSAPMVQATLEGRKTKTRRICKDNGDTLIGYEYVTNNPTYPEYWAGKKSEPYTGWVAKFKNLAIAMPRTCPYGQPGDLLWVRESFCKWSIGGGAGIYYKADHENDTNEKWSPSIHMPKAAARIWLEVVSIGTERVQEISEEDIKAEGVRYPVNSNTGVKGMVAPMFRAIENGAIEFMPEGWQQLPDEEKSSKLLYAHWAELW